MNPQNLDDCPLTRGEFSSCTILRYWKPESVIIITPCAGSPFAIAANLQIAWSCENAVSISLPGLESPPSRLILVTVSTEHSRSATHAFHLVVYVHHSVSAMSTLFQALLLPSRPAAESSQIYRPYYKLVTENYVTGVAQQGRASHLSVRKFSRNAREYGEHRHT